MPGSIVTAFSHLDSVAAVCAQSPPPRPSPVEGEGVIHCGQIEVSLPPCGGGLGWGGMIGLDSSHPFHGSDVLEACLGATLRRLPIRGRVVSFRPYDDRPYAEQ